MCLIYILYESSVQWSPSVMRIPIRLLGDNNRFCTIKLDARKVTIQAVAESWKPGNHGSKL